MLFKDEHIQMIMDGKKTATRRQWSRWHVKVGGIYPVQTEMFQPKAECPAFIKVTDRYKEKLGEMTDEDFNKEGGYNKMEFQERWEEITGEEWNPDEEVYVVEFEYVRQWNYLSRKYEAMDDG